MPQIVKQKLRQGRSEKPEPWGIAKSLHSLELVTSSNSNASQDNVATVEI